MVQISEVEICLVEVVVEPVERCLLDKLGKTSVFFSMSSFVSLLMVVVLSAIGMQTLRHTSVICLFIKFPQVVIHELCHPGL